MRDTCYFCGCFLPGKNYALELFGKMRLVCRACFNCYNANELSLIYLRSADTFICRNCGRTMKDTYYVDTSIGVYCSECKEQNPDLGEYFVCDRCHKRFSVDHIGHTVEGTYCKDCRYELIQGLSSCSGYCYDRCDPDTFPDPICHGCEFSNKLVGDC